MAFKSLSDLIRSVSEDQEFNQKLDEMIQEQEVVTTLFALRMARGVSQGEVASHLGCSQSRVSKIENGPDGDLRLRELAAYAQAVDCDVEIVFKPRNETIVGAVKRHAFRVKSLLSRLAELSHKDEKIAEGAAGFFGEAFFNFIKIISDSAKKLPERSDGKAHVTITVDDGRTGDVNRMRRRMLSKSPNEAHSAPAKRNTKHSAEHREELAESAS